MNVNKPAVGNHNAKYVVLRGIRDKNVFYTTNTPGQDPRFLSLEAGGHLAYDILAYTMTQSEAETIWSQEIPAFLFQGLCVEQPRVVSAGVRPYPE